jgi:hypothetical protein
MTELKALVQALSYVLLIPGVFVGHHLSIKLNKVDGKILPPVTTEPHY